MRDRTATTTNQPCTDLAPPVDGLPGPVDAAGAIAAQEELRKKLDLSSVVDEPPSTVCGLDVSFEVGSDRVAAAAVVVDVRTLELKDRAIVHGRAEFPYIPSLLTFREVPILLEALGRVTHAPEVLVCDGYGIAHPRRLGWVCHIGVVTGTPSFGLAKTPFTAEFVEPGMRRAGATGNR